MKSCNLRFSTKTLSASFFNSVMTKFSIEIWKNVLCNYLHDLWTINLSRSFSLLLQDSTEFCLYFLSILNRNSKRANWKGYMMIKNIQSWPVMTLLIYVLWRIRPNYLVHLSAMSLRAVIIHVGVHLSHIPMNQFWTTNYKKCLVRVQIA